MSKDTMRLYHVYDPMCAWCWGYKPTWLQLESALKGRLEIVYLVGGLAPDTDVSMPMEMRHQIASYWNKIESLLGTQFNHDFWSSNTPRRSTYPACRAMLCARLQGAEKEMLSAVQQAYYLQARNPSDLSTLIELAGEIGLNTEQFERDLGSSEIEQTLMQELRFARSIGGNSFPSLFIVKGESIIELPIDYKDADATLSQIEQVLGKF
ncbi:DsbA family protein [Vibrio inusitatus NBRC 102082]|uniref:DsbA family protein n=1 Tax=Vibrio inusitatus NBRC 102082 TaxID=1219070 RepID=A0A4Y3HTM9_9VIBR|nr:DsbA family protein [Vibrio inusitatus]GEA49654.1 DsbA family protein [Vibrio inusitatus NBRC 102082]